MWNPFRKKKRWDGLKILVPDGIAQTASINFMGRRLQGVQRIVFDLEIGRVARCTLFLAPGMTKIFADNIDLKVKKFEEWSEE